MKYRSKPEIAVLRASVALLALGDRTQRQIAETCGIKPPYVSKIVSGLRREGMDIPRRKGGFQPGIRGPMPHCRSADLDDILDAWADGMLARDIALVTRRSLGSVKEIIFRARRRGDIRATYHQAVAA